MRFLSVSYNITEKKIKLTETNVASLAKVSQTSETKFQQKKNRLGRNVPLIFCSMCAHKFWCVRPFLEMTNICAKTHEEILAF